MLLSLTFLAAPWLLFFWQLSSEFALNPTYQFAGLAPFILGYLAWERSQTAASSRPPRKRFSLEAALLVGFVFLLPLRLIFEANADWRLIQWLQGTLSAGITLVGLYRWGGKPMLKAFGALALLPLLCIPWPTVLEKEIATALMSFISAVSIEVVHLAGFEAHRAGNIIFLSNGTTVGVEEACSGLRSLAGNLFAAEVIGELLSLKSAGRWFLLILSILVAIIFNLIRSLILVLTAATSGSQWTLLLHDTAGWSILIVSFITLYFVGKLLAPKNLPAEKKFVPPPPLPLWLTLSGLLIVLISEPLVSIYYPSSKNNTAIELKATASIGREDSIITRDAERFRTMLFYDRGTSWRWHDAKGDWQLFFFEWTNPRLSRLGGAYHRPERCLPNTGWKLTRPPEAITLQLGGGLQLPATLTHFTDLGGRQAALLFVHWGNDLADIGLDTRLDPTERWQDFLARRRLASRTALQLSVVSNASSSSVDEALVETAQKVLAPSASLETPASP